MFRYEGMFGFDWAIGKNDITGVNFDMAIPIFTTIPNDILKDRFDQTEAFSGWKYRDVCKAMTVATKAAARRHRTRFQPNCLPITC